VIGDAEGQAAAPSPVAATPVDAAEAPASATNSSAPASSGEAPASLSDVIMPQMGESIFEGTITKWLKNPGDAVQQDEPLFEISTDKVDAEIPSPAAGTLSEIKVQAGATVKINTVVAVISTSGSSAAGAAPPPPAPSARPVPAQPPVAVEAAPEAETETSQDETGERVRSSPLVRRIARENNLDLRQVPGTGSAGRITKEDILGFLAKGTPAAKPAPPPPAVPPAAAVAPAAAKPLAAASPVVAPGDQLVPLTRMRAIIAQRMVDSKRTSAHVHTVFKIDMSRIVRIREKEKSKYEQRNGVKLTYMPFLSRAVIATLRKMPIVNASMEGDAIRYHKNINLGIAVALDWGLIVPVIRQAEDKSFLGIARAIVDLAERARAKKLKPEEVASGTFTITNPGIFGEQFGTPVINQPESAILGVGGLFKEPTVVTDENGSDAIAIRSVIRLTLGFDHRIIDGADAGRFMAELKKYLENWNEDIG
jgi:pyruvate dehydrogenase E2 component (dihydrolipoamide acetyltransferase)